MASSIIYLHNNAKGDSVCKFAALLAISVIVLLGGTSACAQNAQTYGGVLDPDGALPDSAVRDVQFATSNRGWLLGDNSLWITEDGGEQWRKVAPPSTGLSVMKEGLRVNIQPRVFSAKDNWIQWGESILKTNDNGRSWQLQGMLPNTDPTEWAFCSLSFLPGGRVGWAAGLDVRPGQPTKEFGRFAIILYHTVDGGAHWTSQGVVTFSNTPEILVKALSEKLALLATPTGLYFTDDGGTRWSKSDLVEALPYLGKPGGIFFEGGSHGWAGYGDGFALETMDYGRTWHAIFRPGDIWQAPEGLGNFGKIYFDGALGLVLGADGQVYLSMNRGVSWHVLRADEFIHDLYCVSVEDHFSCWALGTARLWKLRL